MICSKDSISYRYSDDAANSDAVLAYRLTWQNATGQWLYSRIVAVTGRPGADESSIRLYQSARKHTLTITVVSTTDEPAALSISNALGRSLLTRQVSLFNGLNTISIPLGTLAPATYFLVSICEETVS